MCLSLPEAVRDLTLNLASSDMVSPTGSLRFESGLVTSLELRLQNGYRTVGGYNALDQGEEGAGWG